MNTEQSKFYSKGYNAGRKIKLIEVAELKSTLRAEVLNAEKKAELFDKYFCAALTGLLSGESTWSVGDKKVVNIFQYVNLAKDFAQESMQQLNRK